MSNPFFDKLIIDELYSLHKNLTSTLQKIKEAKERRKQAWVSQQTKSEPMSNNITDQMVKDFLSQLSQSWMTNEWLDKWEQFKSANAVERDWEILKFRHSHPVCTSVKVVFDRLPDGCFFYKSEVGKYFNKHYAESWLLENKADIVSVRRLSDNTTWQIGDEIMFCGKPEKIKEFKIIFQGTLMSAKVGDYLDGLQISSWQKPLPKEEKKPVLFTTIDGKEIREGDTIWQVHPLNYTLHKYSSIRTPFDPLLKNSYSTEQAANEYITYNRKEYSLNDIKNAWSKLTCATKENFLEELSKINKEGGNK